MIPKIIHRMWLDRYVSDNIGVPEKYIEFIKSFNLYNPEFTVVFWNMDKIKKLFNDYPELNKYEKIWSNFKYHMQKCDMARYIILYLFGGLYIDLDFICFKNLSPLLNRELLLVPESNENLSTNRIRICNGFIGSIPRHPFWIEWMDFICSSILTIEKENNSSVFTNVVNTTGPANFGLFFAGSRYKNMKLVSICDIIPLSYSFGGSNKIVKECAHRNYGSEVINDINDYHKHFGNYTHTRWYEGSGWINEKKENRLTEQFINYNQNNLICHRVSPRGLTLSPRWGHPQYAGHRVFLRGLSLSPQWGHKTSLILLVILIIGLILFYHISNKCNK